jgi:hypothetical protein
VRARVRVSTYASICSKWAYGEACKSFCANLTDGHAVQPNGPKHVEPDAAAIQRPDTGTLSEPDSCTVDRSLNVAKPKVPYRNRVVVFWYHGSRVQFGVGFQPDARSNKHTLDGTDAEVQVAGRLSGNTVQVLRKAALAGLGIALLPSTMTRRELRAGLLVPVAQSVADLLPVVLPLVSTQF